MDRLRKADWRVAPIEIERRGEARLLLEIFHYSASVSKQAVALHGLFPRGSDELKGVAWWLPPSAAAAQFACCFDPNNVLALSRLVVTPDVPKNGASFLMMRSLKLLPPRWWVLLTYADTWQGHEGTIYKAAGWDYLGVTRARPVYTLNGRMLATQAGSKTRKHEEMIELGAECVGRFPMHRYRYLRDINPKSIAA